jgi:adenine-specific DNA methylase
MLQNGLGELLTRECKDMKRFIDLFTGSGAVAIHIGQQYSVPVLAYDLQQYSVVLANAVLKRVSTVSGKKIWENWRTRANRWMGDRMTLDAEKMTWKEVKEIRRWCENRPEFPITKAYGGHYFSARQAMWLDAYRATLPKNDPDRTVSLAALIQTASKYAAAPGHTAQPFQPTRTARQFLEESWSKELAGGIRDALLTLSKQHAKNKYSGAVVADANAMASHVKEGDVIFIDPPYSGVQYSRFYHVLETIAEGQCGDVSGVGRYPARDKRPRSKYSVQTESRKALDDLFSKIAAGGGKAIVTFPVHKCSNGLSGRTVKRVAAKHFLIKVEKVKSQFSTLGGTGKKIDKKKHRAARQKANEMMLVLEPK